MLSRFLPPRNSLARRTLALVALRIAVIVAVASVIAFWHIKDTFQDETLAALERYSDERRARESTVFDAAQVSLDNLARGLERRLAPAGPGAAEVPFEALFQRRPDGTWRTARSLFDAHGISGFIGKHVEINPSLKQAISAAYDLLTEMGPAADGLFPNTYVVFPENALLVRWPGHAIALDSADWELFGKLSLAHQDRAGGVTVIDDTPPSLPDQAQRWSDLYFDYEINDWMVSGVMPVVMDGVHRGSVGHDILLTDLLARLTSDTFPDSYNVLMTAAPALMAHPDFMEAVHAAGEPLPIDRIDHPQLKRISILAMGQRERGGVLRDRDSGDYVAVSRLAGPGWYLLTVFPAQVIDKAASSMALLILGLGLAALIFELFALNYALGREVTRPLKSFADTVDRVARGDLQARISDRQRQELRPLADAFNRMVVELDRREKAVGERNEALEILNRRLEQELEERTRAQSELAKHRELNALLDNMEQGVLFLDKNLKSRLANKAYMRMWHRPDDYYDRPRDLRGEIEDSRAAGFYHVPDETWDAYVDARIEGIKAGPVAAQEMRRADGSVLIYECVALPDGGRMLTYFDVSRLKAAEARLQSTYSGMEAAMDGMAILNDKDRYIYVNQAHARIYGFETPPTFWAGIGGNFMPPTNWPASSGTSSRKWRPRGAGAARRWGAGWTAVSSPRKFPWR